MTVRRAVRHWYDSLLAALGVLCAAYWFGNSGAGLALLWWESRRRATGAATVDQRWLDTLDDDRLTFAHVGTFRIVVVGERSGRHDVFRDELSEIAWTRLRRRCLTGQPATGRSTSI